jgi:hypothetical protein
MVFSGRNGHSDGAIYLPIEKKYISPAVAEVSSAFWFWFSETDIYLKLSAEFRDDEISDYITALFTIKGYINIFVTSDLYSGFLRITNVNLLTLRTQERKVGVKRLMLFMLVLKSCGELNELRRVQVYKGEYHTIVIHRLSVDGLLYVEGLKLLNIRKLSDIVVGPSGDNLTRDIFPKVRGNVEDVLNNTQMMVNGVIAE